MHRLSEAQRKQEECATNIEKFLSLIETLKEHKAELATKVETLTIEKSTMEQEQEEKEELRSSLQYPRPVAVVAHKNITLMQQSLEVQVEVRR